ncbi:MAG: hypothetical protein IKX74_04015 [Erysipelotrichaceae bacterium]|nr:hypothetical protein [Erysipelotrichaceae bacterium]MBR5048785.1 hypothetical protein [Erysipelotrichaceae bacterium]
MAISLRLTKEDEELFKRYASLHNMTVSDLVRESVLRRIEDDIDLQDYQKLLQQYHAENKSVTLDDLLKRK